MSSLADLIVRARRLRERRRATQTRRGPLLGPNSVGHGASSNLLLLRVRRPVDAARAVHISHNDGDWPLLGYGVADVKVSVKVGMAQCVRGAATKTRVPRQHLFQQSQSVVAGRWHDGAERRSARLASDDELHTNTDRDTFEQVGHTPEKSGSRLNAESESAVRLEDIRGPWFWVTHTHERSPGVGGRSFPPPTYDPQATPSALASPECSSS